MNATNVSEPHNSFLVVPAGERISPPAKNPKRFPGVSSFEDNDLASELFYGREEESQKLLHYILAENLFLIYSYSGYGKTSLLKARVFRKLREKNICPILVRFNKKGFSPQQLIQSETEAFGSEKGLEILHTNQNETQQTNQLIRYFKSLEIWSPDDKLLTPAIVLDQFEEIFTLAHNQAYVGPFFEDLAGLLKECKEGSLNLKIIVSIREDFLGHLELMAVNIPSVFANRFRLEALRKEQAHEAIMLPAKKEIPGVDFASPPFSFSEKSTQEILDFLSLKMMEGVWKPSAYIEPVQLQIICSELENKIIRGEIKAATNGEIIIQPADYGGTSGLQNIAANFYDQQMAGMQRQLRLTKKDTDAVKELIETGLIAGTRRVPMAYDAVVNRSGIKKEAIDFLVDNKLLKLESHRSNSLLELSHDTLVAPVLKSGEQRVKQKEIEKRKNATLRILGVVLLLVLVALTLYFIYKNKSAKQARLEQYYYTAIMASQQNPTLAYKIALDGRSLGAHANLDTLIRQFSGSSNGFIVNRFQFDDPVIAASFSSDNKTLTIIGDMKIDEWNVSTQQKQSDTAEFFASCFINDAYHFLKWDSISVQLINRDDSVIAASLFDDIKTTGQTKNDEVKFYIKHIEALTGRAAKDHKKSAVINFSYGGGQLVSGKDTTIFVLDNHCYLHNKINDSFFVFDIDQESFVPMTSKSDESNGFIQGDAAKRLKAMTVSGDFRYTIFAADNRVRIKDVALLQAGKPIIREAGKNLGEVNYLAISLNSSLILTAGKGNIGRLWNLKGEHVGSLQGHNANISYANFSPDGKQIITADESGQLLVWKLAKDVKPNELVSFSPFEYRKFGLNEDQYKLERIYDTSTFTGLLAAAQHYEASLPVSSSYVGDKDYFLHLTNAIDEVQKMYEAILQSDSFNNSTNGTTIVDKYTSLLARAFENEQYRSAPASDVTKRVEHFASQYIRTGLQQKMDTANLYANPQYILLEQLISFFRDRKDYSESNKYLRMKIDLLKGIRRQLSIQAGWMNTEIATNYTALSYYLLYEKDFNGMVSTADSALKYDRGYSLPLTNKALGYLLNGQLVNAQAIYFTHKNDLYDSFMLDFTTLENEGIISKTSEPLYSNVQKIKAMLAKKGK